MIDVTYMQNIYTNPEGLRVLHRSHITGYGSYTDWSSFVSAFFEHAVYPSVPTNKHEAYGWCATLFDPSGEEDAVNERNDQFGGRNRDVLAHRAGEFAAEHLTLFVADLDNHKPEHPLIGIDALEEALKALQLSYVLYTSYSHTPARNKVRIIIPVSRPLTPNEAFEVFIPFNHALNYQLDGSVYDPGDFLYGPPVGCDARISLIGEPLDVDGYLELSKALPAYIRDLLPRSEGGKARRATPEEVALRKAQLANLDPTADVSVHNPRYFRRSWFQLADELYRNGSHWETMVGLLAKAWVMSEYTLSRYDMEVLQNGLDDHWCGYLGRTYSPTELLHGVKSAMKGVGTPRFTIKEKPTDRELRAALNRLKRKTK